MKKPNKPVDSKADFKIGELYKLHVPEVLMLYHKLPVAESTFTLLTALIPSDPIFVIYLGVVENKNNSYYKIIFEDTIAFIIAAPFALKAISKRHPLDGRKRSSPEQ